MTSCDKTNKSMISINGIKIYQYKYEETFSEIISCFKLNRFTRVCFINTHCANITYENADYRLSLKSSEYLLNDGAGIELSGLLYNKPFPSNLNGTDWIPAFFDKLSNIHPGTRIFVLGANPKTIVKVSSVFEDKWPKLILSGFHHGFYNDDEEIIQQIINSKTDVLLVAMGVPKQELFLQKYHQKLQVANVKIGIAGGAIIDFLTQNIPRAPIFLQKLRLEWFFRLMLEPRRMWRRYIIGNVVFICRLLIERIMKKGYA